LKLAEFFCATSSCKCKRKWERKILSMRKNKHENLHGIKSVYMGIGIIQIWFFRERVNSTCCVYNELGTFPTNFLLTSPCLYSQTFHSITIFCCCCCCHIKHESRCKINKKTRFLDLFSRYCSWHRQLLQNIIIICTPKIFFPSCASWIRQHINYIQMRVHYTEQDRMI
jgi:hypothetical protein